MKLKTTFILLMGTLALAAYIGLYERKAESTRRRQTLARQAFGLDAGQVQLFRLEAGAFLVECARQNGRWRIVQPIRARADQGAVDRLLDGLSRLPRGELITGREWQERRLSPADFGFEAPRARLVLEERARRRVFLVGGLSPLGDALYVKEEDSPDLLAVSTNLLGLLPRHLSVLRDRMLFRGGLDQIRRLDIRGTSGFIQVVRNEQGAWMIQQPVAGRADRTLVRTLLEQLLNARIAGFVSDTALDLAPFGLDATAAQVALGGGTREEDQILLLGAPTDRDPNLAYAKLQSENSVYTIPAELAAVVRLKPDDLRDRRLIGMPPSDIGRIRLEEGERALEFQRQKDEGWWMTVPRRWKVEDARMELVLAQWAGLRIEAFEDGAGADAARLGFSPPARTLRFSRLRPAGASPETEPSFVVLVSSNRMESGLWQVRVEGEGLLYSVSERVQSLFPMDPLYYRDPVVLELPSEAVSSFKLVRAGVEQAVERGTGGLFRAVSPSSGVVRIDRVQEGLELMRSLVTPRYIEADPPDLARYGLEAPRWSITAGVSPGMGISKTLLVGSAAPDGGSYAMIQGQDVVFLLEEDKARRLGRDLVEAAVQETIGSADDKTKATTADP